MVYFRALNYIFAPITDSVKIPFYSSLAYGISKALEISNLIPHNSEGLENLF
jgi:hypothetical protein